jgi:hypothetical protein
MVWPHNKPLVPTRNGITPSLAAQRRRWASRMNISSERHHSLTFPRKRHGATSAWTFISVVVCGVAPQLRSPSVGTRRRIPVETAVRVPSLGAQLCLSSCRSGRAASRVAVHLSAAARSDTPGLPPSRLRRSAQWPNNSLVPTPATNALSLSVGSGAAQLKR